MRDLLETAELLAFSRIVDTKSLSRAAAELGVPRATISRRLARLEERLGARLLRRTTRSLALTDAGEALYRHARIVLDALQVAEGSVRRTDDAIRGDLRVSVPPNVEASFLTMLSGFAERYPELRLHVHFSTRMVDLVRDGYDVALRASTRLEPGLIARTLARVPVRCVASPAYLARHDVPRAAKDLRQHRCLMGFARGELPETHWPLASGGQLQVEGSFFSNQLTLLCAAAVRGLGIALLPAMFVRPLLESGKLVEVLVGVVEGEAHFAVVYLEREFVPPQVRAFVAELVAWAERELPKSVRLDGDSEEAPRQPARAPAPKARTKKKPQPSTARSRAQASRGR